ncbi:MAG: (2Fe-2S)-binding protein [Hyphomicrobiaceae bacterium]
MIICSCAVISDSEIEQAVLDIMSVDNAPIPTPGIIYRHLAKKMVCCGCAPIAVETIYKKMMKLEKQGLICPCACNTARSKLLELKPSPILKQTSPTKNQASDTNDGPLVVASYG